MDINIKTLQVTLLESTTNVDESKTPPIQEQESLDVLEQVTVVELVGDIDGSTASGVQSQVLPLAQAGGKMLLDMTQVPYMSSAGLRMLLSVYRQITAKDGQVVLVGLSEEIQDTMSITGFLDFFTARETLDAGLEALKVRAALPT
jgi:anti-sigma B factor antagonist